MGKRAKRPARWRGVAAGVALAVLIAATAAGGAAAQEPNRAGLVVQYPDGQVDTRCVEFDTAEISGAELLERSGLQAIVDASSGLGITVCQIEGQGCAYPAEPCFCQCSGTGPCAYWNYYTVDPGGGPWGYAAQGALLHIVRPGAVDAWVWGGGTPPAAELSFEAVCPAAGGAAGLVTASATNPAAATAPAASVMPAPPASPDAAATASPGGAVAATAMPGTTALAGVTRPAATPGPVAPAGGQGGAAYWLFGLMTAGLGIAGLVVWLRGRRARR